MQTKRSTLGTPEARCGRDLRPAGWSPHRYTLPINKLIDCMSFHAAATGPIRRNILHLPRHNAVGEVQAGELIGPLQNAPGWSAAICGLLIILWQVTAR